MNHIPRRRRFVLLLVAAFALPIALRAQPVDSLLLENLGPNVNSAYNDVCPVISPDGKTLYFDRTDDPTNVGRDDIWLSTRQKDGTWSPAKNIGPPLNTRDHNFVCSVSPDGNTLLLGNVYNPDGTMSPGLSMVNRTKSGWSKPQKMNVQNFYSYAPAANYYLANDGKTLLLAIERRDSYGDLDLYVSFLGDGNVWSEPMNLGSDVNTRGSDRTPFLAADGVTLYFASDGRGGYGSSDIFVTRRMDSTWKRWSKPENLGKPINSDQWDGFFTIPASGEYAYMVSGQNSFGETDIFRVKLEQRVRPRAAVLISGHVLNKKTREPLAASVVYNTPSGRKAGGIARTDPSTGAYSITLPAGSKYRLRADAPGYKGDGATVDLTEITAYTEMTRDMLLAPGKTPVPAPSTSRLPIVLFASGSADLTGPARTQLDRVAKMLLADASMTLQVDGHTDNLGTDEANQSLSERRAAAVVEYLTGKGIGAARLRPQGHGETDPVGSNGTAEGRRKNRRVVFGTSGE